MANQTFEKALAASVSVGNSELINQLRPIWQEWLTGNITIFDEELEKVGVLEIRVLLDEGQQGSEGKS